MGLSGPTAAGEEEGETGSQAPARRLIVPEDDPVKDLDDASSQDSEKQQQEPDNREIKSNAEDN